MFNVFGGKNAERLDLLVKYLEESLRNDKEEEC